ncbi:hypothetical protein [Rhizobium sp. BE258]|jgi:hypothetical protein|uniref:hypothetical protein n=1 Tax=Rhizobium sp. BE258 TaxID=2817722 RepID=UPI000DD65CE6|nr:hypothetical protein [Rhizobium sp. BE258]MDR7142055.1 polynucleotide 5'-kinase involved in rRNA processing [Rhizobium sp. BE258]
MTHSMIDHATLSRLAEAGAIDKTLVVGQLGGWSIVVRYGKSEHSLAAQRSRQVRLFKRMETLVSYLKDVGISQFDVDAAEYAAESSKRPDRAEALKRAHEAAEHDRWFREQVEIGLREADDPNTVWISNEDANKEMDAFLASLMSRVQEDGK